MPVTPAPPRHASPTAVPADSGHGSSRRRLLEALKRRGASTLLEAAADVDLSRETVREHLNALAAEGLVARAGARRGRPGRPEVLYRLTERAAPLFPQRDGEVLAELAAYLLDAGGEATLKRFFTERARARLEGSRARLAGLRGHKRLEEVAEILIEQGYMAEVDGNSLRLCHCPIRHVVSATRLPCRAELALVEELLGRRLSREDYLPEGGTSCSYRLGGARRR